MPDEKTLVSHSCERSPGRRNQQCMGRTAWTQLQGGVEHPLHLLSGPMSPSETTLMLAVLCPWFLGTSLGDPLMLPAINKTMRTSVAPRAKCDVLQSMHSALNCCPCSSSVRTPGLCPTPSDMSACSLNVLRL